MNRAEAIRKLRDENWQPVPGLSYEIAKFDPRDAWGVARCYFAVYGEQYPIDTYYVPEKLIEESERGNLHLAVARTSNGDIVACDAISRGPCPHPRVFEWVALIVAPEYRGGPIARELTEFLLREVEHEIRPAAVFGEAVCHHQVVQRMGDRHRFIASALAIGLMPAEAYPRKEFATDRVSTLLYFRIWDDAPHRVFVPGPYGVHIAYLVDGLGVQREIRECSGCAPEAVTGLHREYFEFAQVARAQVRHVGEDFERVFQTFEAESLGRGARVLQFYLNLGEPAVELAVELLQKGGYFFGGFLPRWFDTDGLLMQKVLDMPDFRSIQLYTKRARRLLELQRQDLESLARKS